MSCRHYLLWDEKQTFMTSSDQCSAKEAMVFFNNSGKNCNWNKEFFQSNWYCYIFIQWYLETGCWNFIERSKCSGYPHANVIKLLYFQSFFRSSINTISDSTVWGIKKMLKYLKVWWYFLWKAGSRGYCPSSCTFDLFCEGGGDNIA